MRVYGELVLSAAGVEAPVRAQERKTPTSVTRRWAWLPATVLAAGFVTALRVDAEASLWLGLLAMPASAIAILLMLVRYHDDRTAARTRADHAALATNARSVTATALSEPAMTRVRAADGSLVRGPFGAITVMFDDGAGSRTVSWIPPAALAATIPLPRANDPVALWIATDRTAILLRYEREWAEQVLAQIRTAPPTGPPYEK